LQAPAARANAELLRLVLVPCPPGYWARHWDFGVAAGEPVALVGPSRAADAVVNVLLPLAAAAGRLDGEPWLVQAAQGAYQAHGLLAENWVTRLVRQRAGLAGEAAGQVGTARLQQGLIGIYEGPCKDLRCGACPLAQGTLAGPAMDLGGVATSE
jgi:hypothetical protein